MSTAVAWMTTAGPVWHGISTRGMPIEIGIGSTGWHYNIELRIPLSIQSSVCQSHRNMLQSLPQSCSVSTSAPEEFARPLPYPPTIMPLQALKVLWRPFNSMREAHSGDKRLHIITSLGLAISEWMRVASTPSLLTILAQNRLMRHAHASSGQREPH